MEQDMSRWQFRKMHARRCKRMQDEYVEYLQLILSRHGIEFMKMCEFKNQFFVGGANLHHSQVKILVRLAGEARNLQDGGLAPCEVRPGCASTPPNCSNDVAGVTPREDDAAVEAKQTDGLTPAGRRGAVGNRRWRRAQLCARCHADPPYMGRLCFTCFAGSGEPPSRTAFVQDTAAEHADERLGDPGGDGFASDADLAHVGATQTEVLDVFAQSVTHEVAVEGADPFSVAALAARLVKAARPINDWLLASAGDGACGYAVSRRRTASVLPILILTGWHRYPVWRRRVEFRTALERNELGRDIVESHSAAVYCDSYIDEVMATDQSGACNLARYCGVA
eukprot:TRINITY_DN11779_c0_g2_i6.p1 TRINITY_DN11779_c0_g2~~TRINITY_DN11779_c0_g2_i6.p1  ORF type:complete len:338 (+),score=29.77 TRINITY_DN11779_c0_g2_i6:635-1648(+)